MSTPASVSASTDDDPAQPAEPLDIPTRTGLSLQIGAYVDSLHRRGYTHDGLLEHVRSELEEFERDRDIHPKLGDKQTAELAACFQLILEQAAAYHRASL